MGSIANSQAFGNVLSSLQGVTGQLVTNSQGQVSGRWMEIVNSHGILSISNVNNLRLYIQYMKGHRYTRENFKEVEH